MKTKKNHGIKAGGGPSSAASGKESPASESKPARPAGKSGTGREGKARAFDDLDEMRKDIDALGEILGADGRPVP